MTCRGAFALLSVLVMTACAEFPDLDAQVSETARNSGYPDLIELQGVNAAANEGLEETEASAQDLAQRAKALRKRAKELRKPVLDRRSKLRLEEMMESRA